MDDSVEIVLMNAYARLSAVKCPEKFVVVRPRQSTVADLKRFLRINYPTKPDPRKQKLVFNGRLLTNEQILGEVFKPVCIKCICLMRNRTISLHTSLTRYKTNKFILLLIVRFMAIHCNRHLKKMMTTTKIKKSRNNFSFN